MGADDDIAVAGGYNSDVVPADDVHAVIEDVAVRRAAVGNVLMGDAHIGPVGSADVIGTIALRHDINGLQRNARVAFGAGIGRVDVGGVEVDVIVAEQVVQLPGVAGGVERDVRDVIQRHAGGHDVRAVAVIVGQGKNINVGDAVAQVEGGRGAGENLRAQRAADQVNAVKHVIADGQVKRIRRGVKNIDRMAPGVAFAVEEAREGDRQGAGVTAHVVGGQRDGNLSAAGGVNGGDAVLLHTSGVASASDDIRQFCAGNHAVGDQGKGLCLALINVVGGGFDFVGRGVDDVDCRRAVAVHQRHRQGAVVTDDGVGRNGDRNGTMTAAVDRHGARCRHAGGIVDSSDMIRNLGPGGDARRGQEEGRGAALIHGIAEMREGVRRHVIDGDNHRRPRRACDTEGQAPGVIHRCIGGHMNRHKGVTALVDRQGSGLRQAEGIVGSVDRIGERGVSCDAGGGQEEIDSVAFVDRGGRRAERIGRDRSDVGDGDGRRGGVTVDERHRQRAAIPNDAVVRHNDGDGRMAIRVNRRSPGGRQTLLTAGSGDGVLELRTSREASGVQREDLGLTFGDRAGRPDDLVGRHHGDVVDAHLNRSRETVEQRHRQMTAVTDDIVGRNRDRDSGMARGIDRRGAGGRQGGNPAFAQNTVFNERARGDARGGQSEGLDKALVKRKRGRYDGIGRDRSDVGDGDSNRRHRTVQQRHCQMTRVAGGGVGGHRHRDGGVSVIVNDRGTRGGQARRIGSSSDFVSNSGPCRDAAGGQDKGRNAAFIDRAGRSRKRVGGHIVDVERDRRHIRRGNDKCEVAAVTDSGVRRHLHCNRSITIGVDRDISSIGQAGSVVRSHERVSDLRASGDMGGLHNEQDRLPLIRVAHREQTQSGCARVGRNRGDVVHGHLNRRGKIVEQRHRQMAAITQDGVGRNRDRDSGMARGINRRGARGRQASNAAVTNHSVFNQRARGNARGGDGEGFDAAFVQRRGGRGDGIGRSNGGVVNSDCGVGLAVDERHRQGAAIVDHRVGGHGHGDNSMAA